MVACDHDTLNFLCCQIQGLNYLPGGRGGGYSHMEKSGMLVISLRGINQGFWSHLGFSGRNATIFIYQSNF